MKRYALAAGVLVAILGLSWLFFHRSIKKFLRGPQEISSGRFQDPEGLAIDSAGRIYVSDEDRGTLTVLSPDGETLRALKHDFIHGDSLVPLKTGQVVTIGDHELWLLDTLNDVNPVVGRIEVSAPAGIVDPEGIAWHPGSGEFFVTLEDVRKVRVFSSDFRPVTEFSVPDDPEGIGVLPDHRVIVTFSKADYCQVYSAQGLPGVRFGRRGSGLGEFRNPDFVIAGPDGRIYITDQKNHRIQIFDKDFRAVGTIGRQGRGPGQFIDPEDLAFNAKGELLVADGGNHRIQILKPTGEFVAEIR